MTKNIGIALFCLCVCSPWAWAVTGNAEITVTNDSGNNMPGTSVSLTTGSGTVVRTSSTDSSGTVTFRDVEEGIYTVEVGEGKNKTRTEISITGGQTTTVTVTVPDLVAPPFTIPPTASFVYGDEVADDIPIVTSVDRITDTVNGVEQPVQVREGDPDDLNGRFNFELDWHQTSGSFAIGLGHTDHFYPAVGVTVGRADVTFTSHNLSDPSRSNTFDGDGITLALEFLGLFTQERAEMYEGLRRLFGGGAYSFGAFYNIDAVRQDPLSVPGAVITRDETEINYRTHQVRGFVGYGFGPVYPYAGVAAWFRRLEITGVQEADFSQSVGAPATRRIEFTNKLEDDTIEPLIGVGIRKGRFAAGVEATFKKDYRNFRANAGFTF